MKLKENIKIGATYKTKYLSPNNFKSEEIKPTGEYVKSYKITNKPDAPIFKGILNILKDGRAVINVNYTSYSGVKNKYTNYFDKNGKEIIDSNNSDKAEKKHFDNMDKNDKKLKEIIKSNIRQILKEGTEKYRAEVAGVRENVWSCNAIEYNTVEEAKEWLDGKAMTWTGYDLGRVVPVSTPKHQTVDMKNDDIYQNFRS